MNTSSKTPGAVNIRAAQQGDVDAVADIESMAFRTDWMGRDRLERGILSGDVLVAEMDHRVVGFCIVRFRRGKPSANLVTIAVSRDAEGSGLGTTLLNSAEAEAARRGCRLLRLEVRADNYRAIALYQRAGFRWIGKKPNYYADGIAAIRMHKSLGEREFWLPRLILERLAFAVAEMLRKKRAGPRRLPERRWL
ncbi:MAG: GNAT family N-acetyltransferase [Mesorhizobium sp.]|uniref:GNAT family N-acetyltransferase n=1 Tax=Mesorhizobium sp. TaxID=1871066 RepID=UPI000FE92C5A|nr:GNAT family N-acetyltransferase [Mesorhizobium sp.]RWI19451.1 MAG: GNAT family N-acetyltransferase [Mesorhizobium sp.]